MNPGRAVQGVHFQPGIVGEDEAWLRENCLRASVQQRDNLLRGLHGLFRRITSESGSVLFYRRGSGIIGGANEKPPAKNPPNLLEFMGVAGSDKNCDHVHSTQPTVGGFYSSRFSTISQAVAFGALPPR